MRFFRKRSPAKALPPKPVPQSIEKVTPSSSSSTDSKRNFPPVLSTHTRLDPSHFPPEKSTLGSELDSQTSAKYHAAEASPLLPPPRLSSVKPETSPGQREVSQSTEADVDKVTRRLPPPPPNVPRSRTLAAKQSPLIAELSESSSETSSSAASTKVLHFSPRGKKQIAVKIFPPNAATSSPQQDALSVPLATTLKKTAAKGSHALHKSTSSSDTSSESQSSATSKIPKHLSPRRDTRATLSVPGKLDTSVLDVHAPIRPRKTAVEQRSASFGKKKKTTIQEKLQQKDARMPSKTLQRRTPALETGLKPKIYDQNSQLNIAERRRKTGENKVQKLEKYKKPVPERGEKASPLPEKIQSQSPAGLRLTKQISSSSLSSSPSSSLSSVSLPEKTVLPERRKTTSSTGKKGLKLRAKAEDSMDAENRSSLPQEKLFNKRQQVAYSSKKSDAPPYSPKENTVPEPSNAYADAAQDWYQVTMEIKSVKENIASETLHMVNILRSEHMRIIPVTLVQQVDAVNAAYLAALRVVRSKAARYDALNVALKELNLVVQHLFDINIIARHALTSYENAPVPDTQAVVQKKLTQYLRHCVSIPVAVCIASHAIRKGRALQIFASLQRSYRKKALLYGLQALRCNKAFLSGTDEEPQPSVALIKQLQKDQCRLLAENEKLHNELLQKELRYQKRIEVAKTGEKTDTKSQNNFALRIVCLCLCTAVHRQHRAALERLSAFTHYEKVTAPHRREAVVLRQSSRLHLALERLSAIIVLTQTRQLMHVFLSFAKLPSAGLAEPAWKTLPHTPLRYARGGSVSAAARPYMTLRQGTAILGWRPVATDEEKVLREPWNVPYYQHRESSQIHRATALDTYVALTPSPTSRFCASRFIASSNCGSNLPYDHANAAD